jgi:hypothetical protein
MKLISLSTIVGRRVVTSMLVAFVLAIIAPQSVFAQSNPDVGVWKLNLAKSKYSPGPPPKSLTIASEAVGQGLRSTFEGVDAEGKPIKQVYQGMYDGKPQPTTGVPGVDASAFTRVDSYTTAFTLINAGKVVRTGTVVRSMDGKTITISGKGVNEKGQQIDNVGVYDKQ